jgi:phosphatidate phosphatase
MAYSMVYITIYIQKRLQIDYSLGIILRSPMQFLAINLAIYVGYTRINDHWHHWSDVLMGLIQGSISAIITAYCLSDLFLEKTLLQSQLKSRDTYLRNEANGNQYEAQTRV